MKTIRRFSFFPGARTLKSGIAVALSVFLSRYIPYSLPILAGTAAVICIQPSITVGLQKGFERAKTTVVAGLFGLGLYFLFGANLIVLGLAVIVLISVFKKLRWLDGIVLGSLTVTAIMSGEAENVLIYTVGRVTSTLIGIAAATATNILVAPPRHHATFRQELKSLTDSFPDLYFKAIEAYAVNREELAVQAFAELEEKKQEIGRLLSELDYLKAGAETRFGSILEGVDLKEVVLYENSIRFLQQVTDKIHDIVEVAQRRWQYKRKQAAQGLVHVRSPEFEKLVQSVQELAGMLAELHRYVFRLVGENNRDLQPVIRQQAEDIKQARDRVRERLKYWQVEHMQELDIFSLMSTHRIIFDLEEIAGALTKLAFSGLGAADN
ncbi:MAG: hypothetical protein GX200_03315 [Firmicutes bacterium]|nr:hypothetical protein [Bacillota bacterium]